ncbi:hypothetical protein ACEPAH_509 [Sanghuangporus vaninii]
MEQNPRHDSPPPRSLDRQVVLEEDEYTEALSHIIRRDFFPSLVHLDATNNYLDALRSEDPQLINASVRQLQDLSATPAPSTTRRYQPQQTPSQTPWAAEPSDTPLRASESFESSRPQKRARFDTDMSLDAFQAKYTSEDNSSFIQILEDENKKRKEMYGWAWDAQKRVEMQRERMIEGRERMLMIEQGSVPGVKERLVIEPPKPNAGLIEDAPREEGEEMKGEEKNQEDEQERGGEGKEVAIVPQSSTDKDEKQVDVMAPKKDTRPAGVDGWKFKARNAFMFTPDADVSPHAVVKAAPAPVRGEPKAVIHASTRLPEQNESSSGISEPPSPTRSRIDAAIAGTSYRPRSPTNNGFSLVPSVPSPTPSELGPQAVKQLMTWGTLNSTPRILSSEDPADSRLPPSSTPFHIPAPTSREEIGHKLSNKAVKSLRAKAALMGRAGGASTGLGFRTPTSTRSISGGGDSGLMPPPNWTPRKADAAGSLTPAARRLLDRTTMGAAATRRAEAMGKTAGWERNHAGKAKEKELKDVRWTPSPALTRKR